MTLCPGQQFDQDLIQQAITVQAITLGPKMRRHVAKNSTLWMNVSWCTFALLDPPLKFFVCEWCGGHLQVSAAFFCRICGQSMHCAAFCGEMCGETAADHFLQMILFPSIIEYYILTDRSDHFVYNDSCDNSMFFHHVVSGPLAVPIVLRGYFIDTVYKRKRICYDSIAKWH